MRGHTRTRTHPHTRARARARTLSHTHAHTQTCARARTHTHTAPQHHRAGAPGGRALSRKALGTYKGHVYIMDFNGVERARFTAHKAKVNFISADAAGQYVASCSDDGRVVIHTIGGKEWSSHNYYRPVKSVCVDPTFGTKRDRVFATGGLAGKFIINKRGWFTSQDVILHEGEVRRKEGRKEGRT